MIKCEVCPDRVHNDESTLALQPSGYYLCPLHVKSMADRQAKAVAPPVNGIVMDEVELKGLRAEGLTTTRFYVYMALRIDGVSGAMKTVQISDFCQKWAVGHEDFIAAIASLSKKGVVAMNLKGLDAQAITHKERIESMEKAVERD